jgi:hypothetical protein
MTRLNVNDTRCSRQRFSDGTPRPPKRWQRWSAARSGSPASAAAPAGSHRNPATTPRRPSTPCDGPRGPLQRRFPALEAEVAQQCLLLLDDLFQGSVVVGQQ